MNREQFVKMLDKNDVEYLWYFDRNTKHHIFEVARKDGIVNGYHFDTAGRFIRFNEEFTTVSAVMETIMRCHMFTDQIPTLVYHRGTKKIPLDVDKLDAYIDVDDM